MGTKAREIVDLDLKDLIKDLNKAYCDEWLVPAKMTSSILPPRKVLAPCSPITQASASTTFDFPEPFGPTTQVTPGSNAKVVGVAKDLKPLSVKLFRYKATLL